MKKILIIMAFSVGYVQINAGPLDWLKEKIGFNKPVVTTPFLIDKEKAKAEAEVEAKRKKDRERADALLDAQGATIAEKAAQFAYEQQVAADKADAADAEERASAEAKRRDDFSEAQRMILAEKGSGRDLVSGGDVVGIVPENSGDKEGEEVGSREDGEARITAEDAGEATAGIDSLEKANASSGSGAEAPIQKLTDDLGGNAQSTTEQPSVLKPVDDAESVDLSRREFLAEFSRLVMKDSGTNDASTTKEVDPQTSVTTPPVDKKPEEPSEPAKGGLTFGAAILGPYLYNFEYSRLGTGAKDIFTGIFTGIGGALHGIYTWTASTVGLGPAAIGVAVVLAASYFGVKKYNKKYNHELCAKLKDIEDSFEIQLSSTLSLSKSSVASGFYTISTVKSFLDSASPILSSPSQYLPKLKSSLSSRLGDDFIKYLKDDLKKLEIQSDSLLSFLKKNLGYDIKDIQTIINKENQELDNMSLADAVTSNIPEYRDALEKATDYSIRGSWWNVVGKISSLNTPVCSNNNKYLPTYLALTYFDLMANAELLRAVLKALGESTATFHGTLN